MEDLNNLLQLTETYPMQLEQMTEEFLLKLRVILWGQAAVSAANKEKLKDLPVASPQQTKKRIKRLSSLCEDNEAEAEKAQTQTAVLPVNDKKSLSRKSKRSNADLLATADSIEDAHTEKEVEAPVPAPRKLDAVTAVVEEKETEAAEVNTRNSEAAHLMPPPPAPAVSAADETLNKRPQRAAKLKSEKNLKEPTLNKKLRRPTIEEVKIKLEHEQRPSQMHEATINTTTSTSSKTTASLVSGNETIVKDSTSSKKSDDSVVVLPGKQPSIVSLTSDVDDVPSTAAANDVAEEKKKSIESTENEIREIRIKIKREKVSLPNQEEIPPEVPTDESVFKAPIALPLPMTSSKNETTTLEELSMASSILSSTTNTTTAAPAKKGRKKKDVVHKPIKVERFSDLDPKPSPIASRTRHGSLGRTENMETSPTKETIRPASIYEDAVETPPSRNSKGTNNATVTVSSGIVNETVNLGPAADATMNLGSIPGDATFCTNPAQTTFQVAPGQTTFVMDSNPNATVTLNKLSGAGALADATFEVNHVSKSAKDNNDDAIGQRSFETAKDSSVANDDDSLLTEEEEQEKPIVPTKSKMSTASVKSKSKAPAKTSTSAKAAGYKMPTRTNELFNPLAQSPVKMRVEAFENAAAAATEQSKRPLRTKKENMTPTSATTPVIGKLPAPALGRFLTPTQASNIATTNSAIAKKGTTSASKALPMPKSANASSLHRSNSTVSTKTLQRENSGDDFRKGLHNLAEERKKQREQKHLLAAQQREAKERERAERMAKLAKEREEKRLLKKQQEQEQKKRELEEIQRKLRQQQEEEAAKLKAAKEREMLMQMKQQQLLAKQRMMPPPPKTSTKYTFEMLHEDDSTDDEDKVSYKRPPPPTWSRSHVRGPFMLKQEYTPSAIIDSFFSVQPMTPDLKIIFPNIDARHLKRNSSAVWSTPPRYSELPKY